ncbi:Leucine-rich repeat receptor protein kinase [Melia azedarach]|uniref:Leucine-rich repeat receptor protein kinase n=1 Tax=Melia azedarach TaxID=155640 RepID=A0ACC1Z208_MELAZ|nr:Leucine-rich repeat receptor protein kinase [Melia azedarach]
MKMIMSGSSFLLFNVLILLSVYTRIAFGANSGVAAEADRKCMDTERQALLKFKQGVVDDCGYLSSWGNDESRKDCCKWRGVQCSNRTGHVIMLDLKYKVDPVCPNRPLREFSSLQELYLFDNKLDGSFPENFEQPSPLILLNLDSNQLWGSLPDLSVFPYLTSLDVSDNRLNGTVSEGLGQLSNLEFLDLFGNSLEGTITEAHLSNLSKLTYMDFSFSSLALNFSSNWLPPFKLEYIGLLNCKLGPRFPKWLQSQRSYYYLDISNAGISDIVPTWFWNLSPNLYYLNISYNHLEGTVPDLSLNSSGYPGIDLSSNGFEGSMPRVPSNMTSLNLSKNKFSGPISSLCSISGEYFSYLDLSDNLLSGELPDCWLHWQALAVLNLANNNFSGKVPDLMDYECSMESFNLRNNSFVGELPLLLKKCNEMKILDVGENRFSGTIPAWIRDSLPNLAILSLRSNHFLGTIPVNLCQLSKIQLLDFSLNNISGTIPKCLNNLTAMVEKGSSNTTITHIYVYYRSATLDGFVAKYDDIGNNSMERNRSRVQKNPGTCKEH